MQTTKAQLRATIRRAQSLPPPEKRIALREAAGVSRADLASAVGVTPGAVWMWEMGKRQPTGIRLKRYIEALDVLAANPSS